MASESYDMKAIEKELNKNIRAIRRTNLQYQIQEAYENLAKLPKDRQDIYRSKLAKAEEKGKEADIRGRLKELKSNYSAPLGRYARELIGKISDKKARGRYLHSLDRIEGQIKEEKPVQEEIEDAESTINEIKLNIEAFKEDAKNCPPKLFYSSENVKKREVLESKIKEGVELAGCYIRDAEEALKKSGLSKGVHKKYMNKIKDVEETLLEEDVKSDILMIKFMIKSEAGKSEYGREIESKIRRLPKKKSEEYLHQLGDSYAALLHNRIIEEEPE